MKNIPNTVDWKIKENIDNQKENKYNAKIIERYEDPEKLGDDMGQYQKLLISLLSGTRDRNFLFSDLQTILKRMGFRCHVKGDHFIYAKDGVEEIINIQPIGNKAKPYQVKQVRQIVLRYCLGGNINESL